MTPAIFRASPDGVGLLLILVSYRAPISRSVLTWWHVHPWAHISWRTGMETGVHEDAQQLESYPLGLLALRTSLCCARASNPALRNPRARAFATITERCRPPVHPMPILTYDLPSLLYSGKRYWSRSVNRSRVS